MLFMTQMQILLSLVKIFPLRGFHPLQQLLMSKNLQGSERRRWTPVVLLGDFTFKITVDQWISGPGAPFASPISTGTSTQNVQPVRRCRFAHISAQAPKEDQDSWAAGVLTWVHHMKDLYDVDSFTRWSVQWCSMVVWGGAARSGFQEATAELAHDPWP